MTDLRFVADVPPRVRSGIADPAFRADRTGQGKRQSQVAKLQAQPGEWALVETFESSKKAHNVYTRLRQLGCEAARRGLEVYARWPKDAA